MTYVSGPNSNIMQDNLALDADHTQLLGADALTFNLGNGNGLTFGAGDFINQVGNYALINLNENFFEGYFFRASDSQLIAFNMDDNLGIDISYDRAEYAVGVVGQWSFTNYSGGAGNFPRLLVDDSQLHITGNNGTPAAANPLGIILYQNAGELSVMDAAGNVTLLSSHSHYDMFAETDFHPLDKLKYCVTHANHEKNIAQSQYVFLDKNIVAIGDMVTGSYKIYDVNGNVIRSGSSDKLKLKQ